MNCNIGEIAQTLKNARERDKACSVLIGAGCSVSAGIPTAQGFVDIITKRYSGRNERFSKGTYPACMAALAHEERRDLIAQYIDNAKINWAHIALAQLIKAGYIDRVLTTNFDPLVARACALVGVFPAAYDLVASHHFDPDKLPAQAIFYLHGQRDGFVLLNTEPECNQHAKKLAPVFKHAGSKRVWLVVGYSGENDPVFDHLAKVPHFDNNLYWIGYKDNEPSDDLRNRLLVDGKYAYYTNGFDADSFFVTLAQKLGCFPPEFVTQPFAYVDKLFETLAPYQPPKADPVVDAAVYAARSFIKKAIKDTKNILPDVSDAWGALLVENYAKAISKYKGEMHPELSNAVSWAYLMQGNPIAERAGQKTGEEADRLFEQAGQKYAAALEINKDLHEALNNWGNALQAQAKMKTGEEADRLFEQAGQKYAAALKIKPDSHEALDNWGSAFSAQAEQKTGEEADRLFEQAGKKHAAALKIKADKHEALYNWGNALQAQAKMKTGEEADRLLEQAGQKYDVALEINKELHEALHNWGNALQAQAKMKTGEEADRLFGQAGQKYAAALGIKPNYHKALLNWGTCLLRQYRVGSVDRKNSILQKAKEVLLDAEKIKSGNAAYNLACVSSCLGDEEECDKWLLKSKDSGNLPERAHLEQDLDLDPVREKQWFKEFLETVK